MLHFTYLRACLMGILLLSITTVLSAQKPINIQKDNNNIKRCGTLPPTEDQIRYTLEVVAKQVLARNAGTTCVPMKAHIVRNNDGSGGVSFLDLNKGLANLNFVYKGANIEFYWSELPDYANNTDYVAYDETATDITNGPDSETGLAALFTTATNAVNIYFMGSIKSATLGVASGYAYFPGNTVQENRIFMTYPYVADNVNGTFTHEFGHYFSLFHTHQGTEFGNGHANAENVPRTGVNANCSAKGDLLCDTHADPRYFGGQFTLATCTYTGGGVDANGVPYTPPVENIMSYYPDECGVNYFTPQQYTRIAQGLATRLTHTAYTLNAPPQSVAVASGLTATFGSSVVNLTWTDNATNDMGYLIERSSTSSTSGFEALTFGGTAASATSFTDASVTSNKTYYYRVKASNGNCNTYSNVATVVVPLTYCNPTYTNACFDNGSPMYIGSFTIKTTANATILSNTNNGCQGALSNFSNTTGNVLANTSYIFTVSLAQNGGGSYFPQNATIWIDTNHDGDFTDSGEQLGMLSWSNATFQTLTATLTIPSQTINGATRLRIRSVYNDQSANPATATNPCNSLSYGEAEDYTLNVTGGVTLPIELISFTAINKSDKNLFNWQTATETNNSHFIIQKSKDGQNFVDIGTVKGHGTTTTPQYYDFVDAVPYSGLNYYRLQQFDRDGKMEYSKIVSVETISDKQQEVKIYPNPTHTILTVEHASTTETLEVLNALGQVVKTIPIKPEAVQTSISTSDLDNGIYFLRIHAGNGLDKSIKTIRFVKL
jgi:hypothetical protein